MGHTVSKRQTTAPIPPFENYHDVYTGQGQNFPQPPQPMYAPDYPPPGRPGPDYGPQGPHCGPRRPVQRPLPRRSDYPPQGPPAHSHPMDEDFWDDDGEDPVYLPEPAGPPRRGRPGGFDPFAEDPRRYPPPGGVSRQRGIAGDMIEGMRQQRVNPGRMPQYRTAPPAAYPPPQSAYPAPQQPRIAKYTSYVNEPAGYAPPQQSLAYQPPPQQQAPQQMPQQAGGQQPTVIYYDPQTGAVTGSAGAPAAQQPQQPQVISYPQAAPQMFGFPQGQGFTFPQGMQGMQGMPQMMMMQQPAQQAQQAQPIVIPGQLYTADGGVQRLG